MTAKPKLKPLQRHYSGELSREFWDRINSLPRKRHDALYAAGVRLQEMESTVLEEINNEARTP